MTEEEGKKSFCEICGVSGYIVENPNDIPDFLFWENILCSDTGNNGRIVCEDCDSNMRKT